MLLVAALRVAVAGGIVALVMYFIARRKQQRLTQSTDYPVARWDGVTVAATFVVFILSAHFVQLILASVGFYTRVYGPDFPLTNGDDPTPAQQAATTIRHLWAAAITFPFQLAVIALFARARGGPNPLKPGLFAPNFVAGYLTWLLVTPAAFSVYALANIAHASITSRPPDKHPLTILGDNAGNLEWMLFVLQTVCIAPMLEELVFRGILLPWLSQQQPKNPSSPYVVLPEFRSPLILGLAVSIAFLFHSESLQKAFANQDGWAILSHLIPGLFFVILIPIYLIVPRFLQSPGQTRAIIASSALFAAFHVTVWPSPVPLMVLASGIGYLAVRTQSLIGPVVVHAMFNAVSATTMLLSGQS